MEAIKKKVSILKLRKKAGGQNEAEDDDEQLLDPTSAQSNRQLRKKSASPAPCTSPTKKSSKAPVAERSGSGGSAQMLDVPDTNARRRRSSAVASVDDTDAGGKTIGIKLHAYSAEPSIAWDMLKQKRPVKLVRPMALNSPIRDDAVRFVCTGCLHGQFRDQRLPPGDVLIVAGSFTNYGLLDEVRAFDAWAASQPFDHILCIAGSHDLSMDAVNCLRRSDAKAPDSTEAGIRQAICVSLSVLGMPSAIPLLQNVILLMDSPANVYGINIYGTPWVPKTDGLPMAFTQRRGRELLDKWNRIPVGTDIVVTHCPPLGHGDQNKLSLHDGCVELLNTLVKRVRPMYHVFAHSHYGTGCTSDGYTKFVNCAACDEKGRLSYPPVIFDVPLPGGAAAKAAYKQQYAVKPTPSL